MNSRIEKSSCPDFDWNFLKEQSKLRTYSYMSGTDEVGRGPLAGPVVAATFMIKCNGNRGEEELASFFSLLKELGVNDSKKLKMVQRQAILQSLNIDFMEKQEKTIFRIKGNFSKYDKELQESPIEGVLAISLVSAQVIDQINILQASLLAMKESILICKREIIANGEANGAEGRVLGLIDGQHQIPHMHPQFDQYPIVKGDGKSLLIGLASLAAKEFRDSWMIRMNKEYPGYGWDKNMGYPTKFHFAGINQLGLTPIHRRTFSGVKEIIA